MGVHPGVIQSLIWRLERQPAGIHYRLSVHMNTEQWWGWNELADLSRSTMIYLAAGR